MRSWLLKSELFSTDFKMIIFLKIPEKKSETIFLVNFNRVFNKNTIQKELCEELVTALNMAGKNLPSWFFLMSMLHLTQLTTNPSSIDWFISRHLRENATNLFHVCQTEVFASMGNFLSLSAPLSLGVPQGSILGTILFFSAYAAPEPDYISVWLHIFIIVTPMTHSYISR